MDEVLELDVDAGTSTRSARTTATDGEPMFDLIELMFFAYRDFVGDADRLLESFRFGRAHHRVLHFVNRQPGLTIAELLDILKITKQSLSRVLKELVDAGNIEVRAGVLDRRQRLLFPTLAGKQLALDLAHLQSERFARALRGLPAAARAGVSDFLLAMVDASEREKVMALIRREEETAHPRLSERGGHSVTLPGEAMQVGAGGGAKVLADDAEHLLLVDDDRRIRALLSRYLTAQGYRVSTAADAADARSCLRSLDFDLIVLDVMMPGETGVELARSLRAHSQVPILMLTARADAADRVLGLEAGADDYLVKPYEPKELLLRIASILRRTKSRPIEAPSAPIAFFGRFAFHFERGELRDDDTVIRLTERERFMLRLLTQAAGEPVSREALAGSYIGGHERTIDVQINRLRRKLEDDPANPVLLQTARGAGYRLQVRP